MSTERYPLLICKLSFTMNFFIVEDDRILSLILSRMVQKIGFKVSGTSEFGLESIDLIKEKKPDVILMDILLKDHIDGIQVAGEVKKYYSPIIIYITGNSDETNRQRAGEIGYHDFLVKPIDMKELKTSIKSLQQSGV